MRNSRAWKRSHTATFPDAVEMESEKRAAAAAILVDRFLPLGLPPPLPLSPPLMVLAALLFRGRVSNGKRRNISPGGCLSSLLFDAPDHQTSNEGDADVPGPPHVAPSPYERFD